MTSAATTPQRILIIKPSSLGDIVHALPVLAAIRRAWPAAHVAWLVANAFAPLLDNHPMIDEVIRFDRSRYGRMLRSPTAFAGFWRFVGEIRRRQFDLVIDLQGLVRTGFFSIASGASRRVGFRHARELAWLLYSQRIRAPRDARHAVDQNMAVAAALGLDAARIEFPLALRPAEIDRATELLRADSPGKSAIPFIAVVAGARWVTKQWRPERIAALLDRLREAGFPPCVLLGAPDDREFTDGIIAAMKTGVMDLVGRTNLRELTALLSLAALVITHDSGPMHIAAALGRPVVAIFGPTDPRRCGPYATPHRIVATPIECSPCYRRTCSHHSCMERLDVETVERAVREMLHPADQSGASAIALPIQQ
ncbi:MAG: lipopolysaccharide heptosyltransferase I [Phycisphaerales bacterium]|nr:lipopolysaccharide heptosyltransferase I [Phycisphaerales bacterium]